MAPCVLAASVLFVIVTALVLRFFFWVERRSRAKRAARMENEKARNAAIAEKSASMPAPVPPPQPAPVAAKPAAPDAPNVRPAKPAAAPLSPPAPKPIIAAPSKPTSSVDIVAPSINGTLAPGAAVKAAPPPPPPFQPSREPLPAGFQMAKVGATVQPVGASWTPPSVARPGGAEAPSAPPPAPAPVAIKPAGPLEIVAPNVNGTLPPGATAAAPADVRIARSLSAGAANPASLVKSGIARPAPTPRPRPPPWAIVALKTSLPFRVRRPETRLVGKTAKDVVLISKTRRATRVLGRAGKLRFAAASKRLH